MGGPAGDAARRPASDSARVGRGRPSGRGLSSSAHGRDHQRRFGIADRIRSTVVSSEVGRVKPHRDVFERALRELGAVPSETVFVGDNIEADVGGAGALGMRTVHITEWHDGALPVDVLPAASGRAPVPDAVIGRLDELPALLFGAGAT